MEIRYETLGQAVDAAAARWGEEIGWVFEDRRISFAEMQTRSEEVMRSLLALGVRAGDFVAVLMPNLPEFAYCLFGCAKIGATLVALNTRSKLFEIEHTLAHSEARVLIMVESFLKLDYRAIVQELCGAGTIARGGVVTSPAFPRLQCLVALSDTADAALMSWSDFIAAGETMQADTAALGHRDWREPVLLQYTSGTTARPKGALCNHAYVLNFGVEIAMRLGLGAGEAMLNTQPFYHIGGACGALPLPLSLGCRVVIPEYYEVVRVLSLIERERCVTRSGFAAMYIMELDHPRFKDFDIGSLRSGWCVGTPELMGRVRDRMGIAQLLQLYGATEASGVSGSIDDTWERRSRSCGRPCHGMELAIVDLATGAPLPANASGEIMLRGWCSMNGYLKQPEETAKTITADGWVRSGDRGYVDDSGYLYFQGRLKNMIKVGGENVSAEEVEAMLMLHPQIKMVAVIGVADARMHEVVMAIVELRDGAVASEQDIIDYCRPRMANFRVPKFIRFIEEWPMTGSGKIQIHTLRELYGSPAVPTVIRSHGKEGV